jgi:2'-5' RNA ligase
LRRAFVAAVPPPAAVAAVDVAVAPLRREWSRLRWIPSEQRHVTVQFLGRVTDVDVLVAGLRAAARDVEPFAVQLGGGGAFPRARAATVLWGGVAVGAEELGALAAVVGGATAPLGFPVEDRPYRAHLTLARSTRAADLRGAVDALDAAGPGPVWVAGEVVLFESDTRPEGAVHTVVARCGFGAGTKA